jgi:hypothetical protein
VDEQARRRFGWFVRVYYGLFFVVIVLMPFLGGGVRGVWIAGAIWALGFYAAFWVLSRGLPTTDPPAKATPEQRDAALRQLNRGFGKPLLWTLELVSLLLVLVGTIGLLYGDLRGIGPVLFFGACAALFGWQLRRS